MIRAFIRPYRKWLQIAEDSKDERRKDGISMIKTNLGEIEMHGSASELRLIWRLLCTHCAMTS